MRESYNSSRMPHIEIGIARLLDPYKKATRLIRDDVNCFFDSYEDVYKNIFI